MLECTRSDVRDGVGWKCSSCKTRWSVREGSFFCKVPTDPSDLDNAAPFLGTSEPHVRYCRVCQGRSKHGSGCVPMAQEVCSTRLINDGPVMLGGNGVVVQIDKSLFKHKPKVLVVQNKMTGVCILCPYTAAVPPRKTGRLRAVGVWNGGHFTNPFPGLHAMVDTRDAATLLPIIRAHTAPGTIIHSDEWAAYRRISQDIPHLL